MIYYPQDIIDQFETIATDYDLFMANDLDLNYGSRTYLFNREVWDKDSSDFVRDYNDLLAEYHKFAEEYRRDPPDPKDLINILDLFEKKNVIYAANYCWKVPFNFKNDTVSPICIHTRHFPYKFAYARLVDVATHDYNFTYKDLDKFDMDCSMFNHSFNTLTKFTDESYKSQMWNALVEQIRDICINKERTEWTSVS